VILGSLLINSNQTLTINKGCRIYIHADAPIVVDGSLLVNGLKDTVDRVSFQGDRRDEPYKNFPASWPGIFFRATSKDNTLNYAIIKNAYQGIGLIDPSPNANPKLVLNECIIDNAYDAGVVTVNSSLRARNCLISNCGKNLLLTKGGNYQFTHSTVVTYSNQYIDHRDPVLLITNYVTVNNVPVTANLDALFRNCIFWGNDGIVDDEINVAKQGSNNFNVKFDKCLYKAKNDPANSVLTDPIRNEDPLFDSIDVSARVFDFHISNSQAPGINRGAVTVFLKDLDDKNRNVGLPDLGCYEQQ
jgi:hypothetical protein